MLKFIKNVIKKLPGTSRFVSERDALRLELEGTYLQHNALNSHLEEINSELIEFKRKQGFVPAGHFYSPIPSFDEIKNEEQRIFENSLCICIEI